MRGAWFAAAAVFAACGCATSEGNGEIPCPSEMQMCGETCVDLRFNPSNCGTCGMACSTGQYCSNGRCTGGSCPSGQTDCAGSGCVDLRSDPGNCGTCGHSCSGPCYEGACQDTCPVGFTECSGRCADLAKDEDNCGACGTRCAEGETCDAGDCTLQCPEGLESCSGACVDTRSNRSHCGSCDHACVAGEVCDDGSCSTTGCSTGLRDCSGSCVDDRNDPLNCGGCGVECDVGEACVDGSCGVLCPSGQDECSGLCVSLDSDPQNCGSCGDACRADQVCDLWECACPASRSECSGACVDTRIDPANCGACGDACTGSEACVGGSCTVSCPTGATACGGYCVDTLSDRNNCGACGTACAESESCSDGHCRPTGGVAGDSCAAPIDVTGGGRFTGNTDSASGDYTGVCGGGTGRDVVFRYTLTATTDVHINTLGSTFDTLIYVGTLCGGSTVGCNDDARGTLRSELTLLDQAAGTYYIVLDAYSAYGSGSYALDAYFSAPTHIGGDTCGEPSWMTVGSTTSVSGNTCPPLWWDARDDTVSCGRGTGGKDMVYYFVVGTAGTYTFSTCTGTTWDSILDLRRVCNDESTSARVTCNDDAWGDCGTRSTVTATLDPGVYYLWLDGYSGSACGGYEISVTR